jgi:hypothetical protein
MGAGAFRSGPSRELLVARRPPRLIIRSVDAPERVCTTVKRQQSLLEAFTPGTKPTVTRICCPGAAIGGTANQGARGVPSWYTGEHGGLRGARTIDSNRNLQRTKEWTLKTSPRLHVPVEQMRADDPSVGAALILAYACLTAMSQTNSEEF